MLTLKEFKHYLDYDLETGMFTWKNAVRTKNNGEFAGYLSNGYIRIYLKGRTYGAHQIAWLFITGRWPAGEIDHVNGIRHDNRGCNIRDVSHAVNLQGARTVSPRSKTGVTGVTWNKQKGCYVAARMTDGKSKFLGCFDTIEDAAAAYEKHENIPAPGKQYRDRRKSVQAQSFSKLSAHYVPKSA